MRLLDGSSSCVQHDPYMHGLFRRSITGRRRIPAAFGSTSWIAFFSSRHSGIGIILNMPPAGSVRMSGRPRHRIPARRSTFADGSSPIPSADRRYT